LRLHDFFPPGSRRPGGIVDSESAPKSFAHVPGILASHKRRASFATSYRGPWKLIYYGAYLEQTNVSPYAARVAILAKPPGALRKKFAEARTLSPARGTHALPDEGSAEEPACSAEAAMTSRHGCHYYRAF
jgi:hypothetical protein